MATAVLVLLGALALGVCAGFLVGRALRRRSPWLRRGIAVLVAIGVMGASIQVWARLMIDRSAVARAVVWMDADTGDWLRFPSRPIPAGGEVLPLPECAGSTDVLETSVSTQGRSVPLADLLEETRTTSFLVMDGDCLLVEHYGPGVEADDHQTSFSVAKSFLSTLVGLAIANGDLEGLDVPITEHLPELAGRDERFSDITLRHLVTMASGLEYEERGLPWSDDAVTYYSPDLRDTALSATIDGPPGERWLYNNYNPLLMGLVLERATDSTIAAYMAEHLWGPMGAESDATWSLDSTRSGFEKMESGVNATPRDYVRFGYLFAHEGRVDGRQVVPPEWVREATAEDTTSDPNPGYQHWWWVDTARDGRFFARGNFGQFIYVDDVEDVVIVRTGSDFGVPDWPEVLGQVDDELSRD